MYSQCLTISKQFSINSKNDFSWNSDSGRYLYYINRFLCILQFQLHKLLTAKNCSSRFLYPGIVALMVSSVSFPLGLGKFMAGDLNTHDQMHGLFTNFSWIKEELSVEEMSIVKHWATPHTDIFMGLLTFVFVTVIVHVFHSIKAETRLIKCWTTQGREEANRLP